MSSKVRKHQGTEGSGAGAPAETQEEEWASVAEEGVLATWAALAVSEFI